MSEPDSALTYELDSGCLSRPVHERERHSGRSPFVRVYHDDDTRALLPRTCRDCGKPLAWGTRCSVCAAELAMERNA